MMSRITIKLQRSPSISRVKLIGQPERLPCLVAIFFMNSTIYHLQYAWSLDYVQSTCIMQVDERGQNEKQRDCDTPYRVPLYGASFDADRRRDRTGTNRRYSIPAHGPN